MQKTIKKSYNLALVITDIRAYAFYGAQNGFSRLGTEPVVMADPLWGECYRPVR